LGAAAKQVANGNAREDGMGQRVAEECHAPQHHVGAQNRADHANHQRR
jgi:hypothetical protein